MYKCRLCKQFNNNDNSIRLKRKDGVFPYYHYDNLCVKCESMPSPEPIYTGSRIPTDDYLLFGSASHSESVRWEADFKNRQKERSRE
jgi:hypothetical protein